MDLDVGCDRVHQLACLFNFNVLQLFNFELLKLKKKIKNNNKKFLPVQNLIDVLYFKLSIRS